MNLDQNAKDAVQNLSDAINSAVEKSFAVRDAIENLRELGLEPVLTLKLEIGLQEIGCVENGDEELSEGLELDLTDEDVRTLQRMKIRF
jgi:hypothetical protein